MIKTLTICIALLFAMGAQADAVFAPVADWVKTRNIPNLDPARASQVADGVEYLLVDRQTRKIDGGHQQFYRRVKHAAKRAGLENVGELAVNYDPALEDVTFHYVRILRGDQVIDLSDTITFETIRRETKLSSGILDGALTLHTFLYGLRVGDTLDVAYSINRRPAIGAAYLLERHSLQYGVFVYRYAVRALWPSDQKVRWRVSGLDWETDPSADAVDVSVANGWTEIEMLRDAVAPAGDQETDLPDHFNPYGMLEFSSLTGWGDVVSELETAYAPAPLADTLVAEVTRILDQHADEDARVTAAFRYVQDNIRYVGIELGAGGWYPRTPIQASALGYGDCKDKALLLVSMLARMGINADVALVHLDNGLALDRVLPSPFAFNHAIVRVHGTAGSYWLDPTDSQQGGVGPAIRVSDFGFALPVTPGVTDLVPVVQAEPEKPLHEVSERFVFAPDGAGATLFTTDIQRGDFADRRRYRLETKPLAEISEVYFEYYEADFPGLTMTGDITVRDDLDANEIAYEFQFELNAKALADPEVSKKIGLDPYAVRGEMNEMDTVEARLQPFTTSHPVYSKHTVTLVSTPRRIGTPREANVVTPYLDYSRKTQGDGVSAPFVLEWNIRSKMAVVPADQLRPYANALREVDKTDYRSINLRPAILKAQFGTSTIAGLNVATFASIMAGLILLLIALIGVHWGYRTQQAALAAQL